MHPFLRALLRCLNPLDPAAGYAIPHALVVAIVTVVLTLSGVLFVQHVQPHGGFVPPRQTPAPVRISGALPPASFSLDKYIVRLHNQGTSNSCVGQSIAELIEIENAERGRRSAISSGWIWNRLNGGIDQGISYNDAFQLLSTAGDPALSTYANDGQTVAYAPWIASPSSNRSRSFGFVAAGDRLSIEREIAAGRPVALALPWHDSLVNNWNSSATIYGQSGAFEFWHSTLIYAYDATGVWIVNSWPGWGSNQRGHLAWSFIAGPQLDGNGNYASALLAASMPATPIVKPAVRHFPATAYEAYRTAHHKTRVVYTDSPHHLGISAKIWWHANWKRAGGIMSPERYDARNRVMVVPYQGYTLYWWPGKSWVRWVAHRWAR